jgi:exopolysaccharide production protein ExoZ
VRKLSSVQYLRAIAALLVVVAHAFSYQMGVDNKYVVLAGAFGVQLFFVISGFIMVYICGRGSFAAGEFLLRRAIRIVPLYWIFTTLMAVLALLDPAILQTTVVTWSHYLKSLTFIVHTAPVRGGTSPLLSQGWTLNYEAFFYLVFALFSFVGAGLRVAALSVLFVGLWALGVYFLPSDPVVQFYLNAAPLGFAAGCWAALLVMNDRWLSGRYFFPIASAVAIIGLLAAVRQSSPPFDDATTFFGQLVLAVSLLLSGIKLEGHLRHSPVLMQIGDASYAIYLSHMFTIGALATLAEHVVSVEHSITMIGIALVASLLAVLVGVAVHEAIEKPILLFFKNARRPKRKEMPVKAMSAE